MLEVTVTQAPEVNVIDVLRNAVAEATVRAYGAEREYAIALCTTLPFAWYSVEHSDKSEGAKPVHAEKKALFKVLNAAKHTNPSTVWARVRKYAQEHVEGKPEGEGATGEGEGESVGAKARRSLTLRFVEELTTLYKAGKNAEAMSDKEQNAHTYIASALSALGIDLTTIQA
jgi:hypothetical protein